MRQLIYPLKESWINPGNMQSYTDITDLSHRTQIKATTFTYHRLKVNCIQSQTTSLLSESNLRERTQLRRLYSDVK